VRSTCTADGVGQQLVTVVAGTVERSPRVAAYLLTDAWITLALVHVYSRQDTESRACNCNDSVVTYDSASI